ncbi:MAG TPA: patatin-like phospholipase family protein [Patescibacteria group bacterium]|nr:patatin-like phospholipase family protein [Patescibacteria group bacterium]
MLLALTLGLALTSWAAACEPARAPLDAPLALVLTGGGAKGAWEAGAAAALVERGTPVRLVAGSSAGALTAAMLADGRLDRLEALWGTVTRDHVYALRPGVFFAGLLPGWLTLVALNGAGSLLDPAPMRDLIAGAVDLERIRTSSTRLLVVTVDLVHRTPRLFDNATVTVDALLATSAVPGAFPPVPIDGGLLVDGGITARAPVLEALSAGVGVGRALVLLSHAAAEGGQAPTNLRRTLEEAFEMAMIHQIRRDTELARFRHPDVEIQMLTPAAPLRLRPLDFDPPRMAEAFARGRADALACLQRWQSR